MRSKASVIVVEDSPSLALTYEAYLSQEGLDIAKVETGKEAMAMIGAMQPSVILLDLKLPDMDGLDILKWMKKTGITSEVIVITAHGSVSIAVDAMQAGARDFLLKPFSKERLVTTVRNALKLSELENIVEQYRSQTNSRSVGSFIGESAPMKAVYRMIEDAAPSKASVFIMGASGTGKELCAEAIHQHSSRKEKPFIALNCAAIPANLIESEVFGHKKGAFTGATEDRDGAAVKADGGTLFLDEICEMPLDLQAKLLRFIQSGTVMPLGSTDTVKVNVRFVCATNKNPWEEVEAGNFREDLYYRLHVIPIHLPPLADRGGDIVQIAEQLLIRYAREENKNFTLIDTGAQGLMMSYDWPGNVRELSNVIQSAVVLNDGPALTGDMISHLLGRHSRSRTTQPMAARVSQGGAHASAVVHSTIPSVSADQSAILPLAEQERKIIEFAIQACDGRVRKAAKALEVNPSTLYRKLKTWGIEAS